MWNAVCLNIYSGVQQYEAVSLVFSLSWIFQNTKTYMKLEKLKRKEKTPDGLKKRFFFQWRMKLMYFKMYNQQTIPFRMIVYVSMLLHAHKNPQYTCTPGKMKSKISSWCPTRCSGKEIKINYRPIILQESLPGVLSLEWESCIKQMRRILWLGPGQRCPGC